MRFLANENFPFPSIKKIIERGYSVESIAEKYHAIKDEQVIELALKENRIILTFDKDYGELIFRKGPQKAPSVIFSGTKAFLLFMPANNY